MLKASDFRYRFLRSDAAAVVVDESLKGIIDDIERECPSLRVKIKVDTGQLLATLDEVKNGSSPSSTSPVAAETAFSSSSSSWVEFSQLLPRAEFKHDFHPTRFDEPMMIFFTSGTTGVNDQSGKNIVLVSRCLDLVLCLSMTSFKTTPRSAENGHAHTRLVRTGTPHHR